jgi:hypothetical protein
MHRITLLDSNLRINLEYILHFCLEATCGYVLSEENCSTDSSEVYVAYVVSSEERGEDKKC